MWPQRERILAFAAKLNYRLHFKSDENAMWAPPSTAWALLCGVRRRHGWPDRNSTAKPVRPRKECRALAEATTLAVKFLTEKDIEISQLAGWSQMRSAAMSVSFVKLNGLSQPGRGSCRPRPEGRAPEQRHRIEDSPRLLVDVRAGGPTYLDTPLPLRTRATQFRSARMVPTNWKTAIFASA